MPWQERHSRLTTFFRWLLVIPSAIWCVGLGHRADRDRADRLVRAAVHGPLSGVAVRVPCLVRALCDEDLRLLLAGDRPLAGLFRDADDGYPVRLVLGAPLPAYGRLKVALRIFLLIPVR